MGPARTLHACAAPAAPAAACSTAAASRAAADGCPAAARLRALKSAVLALKSLQKSMIFRPAWPSAGPTGGLGLAWPAGMTSRIVAVTALACGRRGEAVW